ncbi:TatD family hydrolase [Acholeplasma sp. OttesenSCG-928-E16]|nr:TatD family hydrolase [Acholeplasma sp. OttesenSCG-928-E16]
MIDTHTHLNLIDYDNDLDEVIKSAKSNGVDQMIVVAIDTKSAHKAIELSKRYECLYPTAGIHPSEVDKADFVELERIIRNEKIYAIGECGIDLYWVKDNIKQQLAVFIKQVELSIKYQLPLIIHFRNSFLETYNALLPYKGKIKGVFHCFSGNLEEALMAIDLGFVLGIGGVITFKNAKELKKIVENVDLKNILLETDCPYLAPTPYRGQRNEPKYLKYIIDEISKIKNIDIKEINKITNENATRLFKLNKVNSKEEII